MRGERSSFPKRDMKCEQASTGSSAVKTYKMSPEELEDYRARTGYKAPTNSSGIAEKHGMDLRTKPKVVIKEESISDKQGGATVGRKPAEGPNKEVILKRIASGKTIAQVERELCMRPNSVYYWLKKWDLIGITPGKAREILGVEQLSEEVIKVKEEVKHTAVPIPTAAAEMISNLTIRINGYEEELSKWAQLDSEKQLRITELAEDRDQWRQQCMEARQAVRELEEERQLLLQTIESSVENAVEGVFIETVNHPDHYTAGGIEVIDFIVAKLNAEEFVGFCKGNILKYASRANHKGGVEDLRKAKWYVDRLIAEVDVK